MKNFKQYSEYKDSGVEFIGEIPRGWECYAIKRALLLLTDYDANGSFSTIKENVNRVSDVSEQYAWFVRATDLENNSFNENKERIVWIDENTYTFLSKSYLDGGELLIAKRGEIGKVYLMPNISIKATLAPNLYLLRLDERLLLPIYMYYYYISSIGNLQLKNINKSTTIGAIYKDDVKRIVVPYPPLSEQQQIANYLDQKTTAIDQLIQKKEQLIQLLEEKRTAMINQAVTKGLDPTVPMKDSGIEWLGEVPAHWNPVRLKHIVAIKICDGPHETPNFVENGIPFLSAESIKGNKIDLNYKRGYITEEQHLEYSKKSKVKKGDILFCKSGSTTGKSALVDINDEFGIWSPLAIIRGEKSKVNHKYLFNSIQAKHFKLQVENAWTFGTQPNIGMGAIENLWVCFPLPEEQLEIITYLDGKTQEIDQAIAKTKDQIKLLGEYKTTLISDVVTGKIDVREAVLEEN